MGKANGQGEKNSVPKFIDQLDDPEFNRAIDKAIGKAMADLFPKSALGWLEEMLFAVIYAVVNFFSVCPLRLAKIR